MPVNDFDDSGSRSADVHDSVAEPDDDLSTYSTIRRLPPDGEIIGRDKELADIWKAVESKAILKRASISVITGPAGIGKSSLALHVAHSERAQRLFPHGQLYFDPHVPQHSEQGDEASAGEANEDPVEASARQLLRDFLTAVGMSPDKLAESRADLVGQFAEATKRRRYLIIVDNVADEHQVKDFIRANRNCHIMTIARHRLAANQIVPGMPGSYELPIVLDGLAEEPAIELFRRHAHETADLSEQDLTGLKALIEPCDGNPLAIRVLGATRATHRHQPLSDFVSRFDQAQQWTGSVPEGNPLWASFKLSYDALDPAAKALFRSLGAVPGKTFDRQLAAALTAGSAPDGAGPAAESERARRLLVALFDAQLIQPDYADYYTMHALLRDFARKGLEDAEGLLRASPRIINGYYLERARRAGAAIHARQQSEERQLKLSWLSDERQNLVAAIMTACEDPEPANLTFAWRLCEVLTDFLELRCGWETWEQTHRTALDRLESSDAPDAELGQAHLLRGHGRLNAALHRWDEAIADYHRAIVLFRLSDTPDTDSVDGQPRLAEVEVASTLRVLGDIYRYTRKWDPARNCLERAIEVLRRSDRRSEYAIAMRSLGAIRRADLDFEEAMTLYQDGIAILGEVGDERWEAAARLSLADILLDQGLPEQAEPLLQTCLGVFAAFEDFHWYGLTLRSLGEAQRLKLDYESALESLAKSDETLRQIGDQLWRASVLHAKGMVHLQKQQHDEALECFRKCLEPFRSNDDALWVGRTYLSIGQTLTLMHDGRLTVEARRMLNTAWPLLIEQKSQDDIAQLERLLALPAVDQS